MGASQLTLFFVKPDHDYQSYTDYWRLVSLSNFAVCSPGDIQPDASHTYIHTWFTARFADVSDHPARHILWCLEWIQPDRVDEWPKGMDVWASDQWYADLVGAKYVLFGSHPGLAHWDVGNPERHFERANGSNQTWDVALLMYREPPRRAKIIHELERLGISIAPDGWGRQRHESIVHSKLMLHIHQHDGIATVAPQRWALAAAYGKLLVTEPVASPDDSYRHVLDYSYDVFPTVVHNWLGRDDMNDKVRYHGIRLHHHLCIDHPFRACVEAAL